MTLRWFIPRQLRLADLECMGVRLMDADGHAIAHRDEASGRVLLRVGDVTLYKDGRVRVWPRRGIDLQRALPALLTSAEDALMGRQDMSSGWCTETSTKFQSTHWRASVYVQAPDGHPLAEALRCPRWIEYEDELVRDERISIDVESDL
jgi:hypothetical protein